MINVFFSTFRLMLTLLGGKAESITLTTIATRKNDLKEMILHALEYSKMKEKGENEFRLFQNYFVLQKNKANGKEAI